VQVGQEDDIRQGFGSRFGSKSLRCIASNRLQIDLDVGMQLVEVLNEQVVNVVDEGSGQRTETHTFFLRGGGPHAPQAPQYGGEHQQDANCNIFPRHLCSSTQVVMKRCRAGLICMAYSLYAASFALC